MDCFKVIKQLYTDQVLITVNMLFSPSCTSIILCTCHLKRQEVGTNALFSFAMVKRNVLAEHVYTFLIISGAICIIRPNQAIYQGLPRTTHHIFKSKLLQKNGIGAMSAFIDWMPMKVVSICIQLILRFLFSRGSVCIQRQTSADYKHQQIVDAVLLWVTCLFVPPSGQTEKCTRKRPRSATCSVTSFTFIKII